MKLKVTFKNFKIPSVFALQFTFLLFLQSCCMTKQPEQEAGVLVVFEGIEDSYKSKVWVIETEQGNPDAKIDSVYYGPLHHITNYTFFLPFRKTGENGDYYIYADSVRDENVIREMDLRTETDKCGNEEIFYQYKFNGLFKTEEDKRILVYQARP